LLRENSSLVLRGGNRVQGAAAAPAFMNGGNLESATYRI